MAKLETTELESNVTPKKKTAAWTSIHLSLMDYLLPLFGFFISKVKLLFSITPFGFAFFASAYNGQLTVPLMVLIGVGLGNLSGFVQYPVKYALANVLFVVVASLKKKYFVENHYFCGALAAASMFLCGMFYVALDGFLLYDVFVLLLESLVVFASVLVFKRVIPVLQAKKLRTKLQREEFLSIMILAALVVAGLGNINLPFFADLQGTFAVYIVLLLSVCFGVTYACPCAIGLGFLTGAFAPVMQNMVATYALSGLLAGIFGKFGKFAAGIAFLIGNVVMTLFMGTAFVGIINPIDVMLALAILLFTPKKFLVYLEESVTDKKSQGNYDSVVKDVVLNKLQGMADSFLDLSVTFKEHIKQNRPENAADISYVFDGAAEQVCTHCARRFTCWEKNSMNTYNAMTHMMDRLQENGAITIADVPSHFKTDCTRLESLVSQINRIYELSRVDYLWKSKMVQNKKLVTHQLLEISQMIQAMKTSIDDQLQPDPQLRRDIELALDSAGVHPKQVLALCMKNGTCCVDLFLAERDAANASLRSAAQAISQVLDVEMALQEKKPVPDGWRVTFLPKSKYTLATGACQRRKDGELECGDSYTFLPVGNGKYLCALSDGMGSGKDAKTESQTLISLLENFLKSGFDRDTAIKMIHSVTSLSGDQEHFSTIDMVLLDLNGLSAEWIKTGAVLSFIKSGSRVRKVDAPSLPVGAGEEPEYYSRKVQLEEGDYFVLLSDGILKSPADEAWLKSLLCAAKPEITPVALANYILKQSTEKNQGHADDDMTVLVCRVEKAEILEKSTVFQEVG